MINLDTRKSLGGYFMKSNDDNLDDLLKSIEDFESDDSYSMEENNADDVETLSALEKLMAELQSEEENDFTIEDDGVLSEEDVNILLDNAKFMPEESTERAFDTQAASEVDMAEIEALLGMSETDVLKESNNFLDHRQANDTIDEVYVEEEILELDPAELDALLSADSQENTTEESTKDIKKKSFFGGKEAKTEGKENVKEKKEKAPGILGKLFSILMEEIPEEEPQEASTLNLSQENKEILTDLDKEKAKKSKKKDKKDKKSKKEKEENSKKPKKEKKVKVKKEKKPKAEKVALKPEKRLPRKKVVVTFVFAFSVLAAILIVDFVLPPILSTSLARESFNKGEYEEAYQEYYGKKLSEDDEMKFQGAKIIMRMQSNLDGYHSYTAIDDKVMALHSLLEGVHIKEDVFAKAQVYGVVSQVQVVYNEILNLLNSGFSLTEEQAIQLTNEQSDVVYTKQLHAITGGQQPEFEETVVEEAETEAEEVQDVIEIDSQEDLLPEEMELLQGGE